MARRNIYSLSAADRRLLAQLIGEFSTETIVAMHRNMRGIHGGDPLRFLSFHRDYVQRLERWLRERGFSRFVPLPAWSPRQCVPQEFRIRITNPCPNVNFFPRFSRRNLMRFSSERSFAQALEQLHNTVHNRLGGIMRNVMSSPSTPLFWIWHAFIDDIWLSYQEEARRRRSGTRQASTRSTGGRTVRPKLTSAWINRNSGVKPHKRSRRNS